MALGLRETGRKWKTIKPGQYSISSLVSTCLCSLFLNPLYPTLTVPTLSLSPLALTPPQLFQSSCLPYGSRPRPNFCFQVAAVCAGCPPWFNQMWPRGQIQVKQTWLPRAILCGWVQSQRRGYNTDNYLMSKYPKFTYCRNVNEQQVQVQGSSSPRYKVGRMAMEVKNGV